MHSKCCRARAFCAVELYIFYFDLLQKMRTIIPMLSSTRFSSEPSSSSVKCERKIKKGFYSCEHVSKR